MAPRPTRPPQREEPSEDKGAIVREYRRAMYQYSFLGLEFGVAILIGVGLGYWADSKWDTGPWLMLLGFAFGLTAAMKDFMKAVRKAKRVGDRPSPDETPPKG